MPNLRPEPASHHVEQELVGAVRPFDRDAELLLQFGRAAGMVDMAVREPDFLDRDLALIDGAPDLYEIAARIDDDGALRLRAPQQRAVLLERRDRDDDGAEVLHDNI
jgi:hypothetical protein